MTQKNSEPSLFELVILSFGNAALVGLGVVPEPGSQTTSVDLEHAHHNIDILEVLQQKTKGNLTPSESQMLESVLYDLRLKFIEAKKQA